jgi:hypothetical protein
VSPVIFNVTFVLLEPDAVLGDAKTVVTEPERSDVVPYLKDTVAVESFAFTTPFKVAVVPTPTFVAVDVVTVGEDAAASVRLYVTRKVVLAPAASVPILKESPVPTSAVEELRDQLPVPLNTSIGSGD